jgi:hypothetical protein
MMKQQPVEMDIGKTLYCLEVLQAVQTDSHTSGWYWGDVRGKAGVGAATNALWRRDLICSGVGRPPFQLTPNGEAFLKTHKKAWQAYLDKTDRHKAVQYFAAALQQIPEIHEARNAE